MFDLIIRGGTLVSPAGLMTADIAVEDGRIAAIGPELAGALAACAIYKDWDRHPAKGASCS